MHNETGIQLDASEHSELSTLQKKIKQINILQQLYEYKNHAA